MKISTKIVSSLAGFGLLALSELIPVGSVDAVNPKTMPTIPGIATQTPIPTPNPNPNGYYLIEPDPLICASLCSKFGHCFNLYNLVMPCGKTAFKSYAHEIDLQQNIIIFPWAPWVFSPFTNQYDANITNSNGPDT